MDKINKQVSRARRRMIAEQFLNIITWTLFGALLVAMIALAVPKFLPLAAAGETWNWAWLGGALGAGLLIAIGWTYFVRRSSVEAAIEIDRRFGLKERVSSSLTLAPSELDSDAGRALVADAQRRVERIDVGERFGIKTGWRALLPLVPALVVAGLFFLNDAKLQEASAATSTSAAVKKQISNSTKQLQKKIAERRKQLSEKGLKEFEDLVQEIERGVDDLNKDKTIDRKKAMIKLNDLVNDLQKRRKSLGDSDQMKKQLSKLQNINNGPADKMAQAMKQGDFKTALDELNKLTEQLKNGQLSEEQKEQLAKQMDQLKKKLEQIVQAQKDAKAELERKIQEKMRQGDMAAAGKLQQQLDKLKAADKQMNKLQKMANNMGNAAEQMRNGNMKDAAQQMSQMASDMQSMQQSMETMQAMDEIMQQIADAKDAMNCSSCNGEGCEQCQGMGDMGDQFGMGEGMGEDMQMGDQFGMGGQGQGMGMGDGLGQGQGQGDRPEEKTDTGGYDSRVRGNVRKGAAVRVGDAEGPNRAGAARSAIQENMAGALSEDYDPLVNQRLPKLERDHANDYFEKIRKGE